MVNRNSLFLFLADFVGSFIVSGYPLIFLAFLLPYIKVCPLFSRTSPRRPKKCQPSRLSPPLIYPKF